MWRAASISFSNGRKNLVAALKISENLALKHQTDCVSFVSVGGFGGWPDAAGSGRPAPSGPGASGSGTSGAAPGKERRRHGFDLLGDPVWKSTGSKWRRPPMPLSMRYAGSTTCFRITSRESEWSQINRQAAEKPLRISPEMFRLLAACLEYSRESEGAFDISVGPLMKVWGFYKGTGHLPHRAGSAGRAGQDGLSARPPGCGRADGVVRPPGRGTGPGRHRQRIRRGPHGGRFEDRWASGPLWWRDRAAAFTGWARRPDEPRGWAVDIKNPWDTSQDGRRRCS